VTGQITIREVIELINRTKGKDFEISAHHFIKDLDVYIFKPVGWYIKCYIIEPNLYFISVHRQSKSHKHKKLRGNYENI